MRKKLFTLLLAMVAGVVTTFASDTQVIAPHIEVSPEQDTFNSGKIKIYDVYCTDSRYVGCNERDCDPYEYTYAYAKYDYITINGVVYNYASKSDSIVSFKDNGYENRGNVDNPDYIIDNLSAGNYHIVFYTTCDSVVKDISIERYGIKINDIYYTYFSDGVRVSFRGSYAGEYEEYFGNVVIPDSVTLNGKTLPVIDVEPDAFAYCPQLTSITFKSKVPPHCMDYLCTQLDNLTIYVPFGSKEAYKAAYGYCRKWMGSSGCSGFFNTTIHVINPSHVMATTDATSATITLGVEDEVAHIASCGIAEGESTVGNVLQYIGLEPNSTYSDIPLFVKTIEGDSDVLIVTFSTTALTLTTKPSKSVSATTAILLAETNMSDAEVSCGFEYKRNDAPDDMAGTKVFCPVASGQMAGRLKNLKDDVYYKYRAFYQSAAGNMYYGDWQYIFTGDVAVEFDPILYTYGATVVRENEATISGYALAGSEDFTEQGFEYWAESRANNGANAPRRMPAALNEHFFVQASGIALRATLNNLDAGTVYRYRVYGKVGDQYYYGSEQTFTTTGTYTPPTYTITFANWDGATLQSSQVEEGTLPEYTGATPIRPDDEKYTYVFDGWTPAIVVATADATYTATYQSEPKSQGIEDIQGDDVQCTKFVRNCQILILRGDKTYTLTGQEVK